MPRPPGCSVSPRPSRSNQLLFGWRKAYREGQLGDTRGFVPAMIVAEQPEKRSEPGCGRIEIVSANGRRVIVDCDIDVETRFGSCLGLRLCHDPSSERRPGVAGDRSHRHAEGLCEPVAAGAGGAAT